MLKTQDKSIPKYIASFARRRGRKLTKNERIMLDSLRAQYFIDSQMLGTLASFMKQNTYCVLEIGFGSGEHILSRIEQFLACKSGGDKQQACMIGCEPFVAGIVRFIKKLKITTNTNDIKLNLDLNKIQSATEQNVSVKVWPDDARLLIEALPEETLHCTYILFPDPWPKIRHHKRRLINETFMSLLASRTVVGGHVVITTDHTDYASWIRGTLYSNANPELVIETDTVIDYKTCVQVGIDTRYAAKAHAAGRDIHYFVLLKSS